MFKVVLSIHHKTCWGSTINLQFPHHQFSSVDCRWLEDQVAHIVLVRGDPGAFNQVIKYLQKRSDVRTVELLSKDESTLYLRVLTKKDSRSPQFSDIFFEHHCFPLVATRFEGSFEVWTLGTADKNNIAVVYDILQKHHPTSIKSLQEEKKHDLLTSKQREALTYASHFGYYHWPRLKSLTQICTLLKIPKTVFLSHLRKAEIKVLQEFLSQ